jgi:hypothetical protein
MVLFVEFGKALGELAAIGGGSFFGARGIFQRPLVALHFQQ